jgi:hypothetical protein
MNIKVRLDNSYMFNAIARVNTQVRLFNSHIFYAIVGVNTQVRLVNSQIKGDCPCKHPSEPCQLSN